MRDRVKLIRTSVIEQLVPEQTLLDLKQSKLGLARVRTTSGN